MTLETIVDMYGSSIGKHLVSRRVEINKEGAFKGVKTYRIELWDVDKHEIIEFAEMTAHMPAERKEEIVNKIEYSLTDKMFHHVFE